MTSHLSPADRDTVSRIWEHLRAAQALLEELTGENDPTGLRYSRDDDEPLAALLPPGGEGFAPTGRPRGHNSSPTGFASDTRREAHSSGPGPVGAKLPEVVLGDAFGMGAARLGGLAAPTLRGGVLR